VAYASLSRVATCAQMDFVHDALFLLGPESCGIAA
jgi:hypothetical protein